MPLSPVVPGIRWAEADQDRDPVGPVRRGGGQRRVHQVRVVHRHVAGFDGQTYPPGSLDGRPVYEREGTPV